MSGLTTECETLKTHYYLVIINFSSDWNLFYLEFYKIIGKGFTHTYTHNIFSDVKSILLWCDAYFPVTKFGGNQSGVGFQFGIPKSSVLPPFCLPSDYYLYWWENCDSEKLSDLAKTTELEIQSPEIWSKISWTLKPVLFPFRRMDLTALYSLKYWCEEATVLGSGCSWGMCDKGED